MIISQDVGEIEAKVLSNILDAHIEAGKCVEIYMENKDMLYIRKVKDKEYIYGFYPNGSSICDEWKANECDTYYSNGLEIDLRYNANGYLETREFDIPNVVKIYVGDEWSN